MLLAGLGVLVLALLLCGVYCAGADAEAESPSLLTTIIRLLFYRGTHRRGVITGIVFPIRVSDLLGSKGPYYLNEMLRHGKHLPDGVAVKSIVPAEGAKIKDGVKGDKAVIEVEYEHGDGAADKFDLPTRFFVKFNLRSLSQLPMRVMCDTSEVCKCEAVFYQRLASRIPQLLLRTPKCFFTDYNNVSGEFVLLTEVLSWKKEGTGSLSVLPFKHRIRDDITVQEQELFITAGAKLNALFSGKEALSSVLSLPRFEATHRRFWVIAQLIARFNSNLVRSSERMLGGKVGVNDKFMTWQAPEELRGNKQAIGALIRDMPAILSSLCEDASMVAFGHNDIVTDNAYVYISREDEGEGDGAGGDISLGLGLFDWQQSCVNNVGQEWAWNFHFLPPAFLTTHENKFIDLILQTYAKQGLVMSKEKFLNAYVLGTAQMFVFGGGGLQLLLGNLHKRGLFEKMVPNDPRCRGDISGSKAADAKIDDAIREKIVGAEMTRRTFTNCCNIMRRHNFVEKWLRWRQEQGLGDIPGVVGEAASPEAKKSR